MNWCYKYYAMIIPCLHHQEIYDCYHCYMPCIKISNKNLHHTSWYLTMWCNATLAKIFEMCTSCPVSRYQTKSCFTVLRIDILPHDEMLQLMNTWNVILYLIDLSINLCLSYMNLLNVILRMISDLTNAWFVFTI